MMSDEGAERDLLKAVFARHGARVTEAYSTAEAVALIMRKRPDVFVADFEMAGPNSPRLLQALEGTGMGRTVPTIAIVNEAPTDPVDKTLLALFHRYLTRPLDPLRLTESIRALANGRRRRRRTLPRRMPSGKRCQLRESSSGIRQMAPNGLSGASRYYAPPMFTPGIIARSFGPHRFVYRLFNEKSCKAHTHEA